jgi:hypothetical protein
MLKTTSGSSPRIDLSNNITYSQSQSHATVPLITYFETKNPVHSIYFPSKNGNLKLLFSKNQQELKVVKIRKVSFRIEQPIFYIYI